MTSSIMLEVLGCGGASSVPRPFCQCVVCLEAREKGAPYTRYCPSLFLHGFNLLIDTGEESIIELNRANILRVDHLLYSHWHPDHTAGIRVLEANYDPDRTFLPGSNRCTQVYLPVNVAPTFRKYHALSEKLDYLEQFGIIRQQIIPINAVTEICVENTPTPLCARITPFVLWASYACGYLFEIGQTRFVVCMDEVYNWRPPAWLGKLDFIVIPAGMFDFHPLTGETLIPANHPILKREATHAQILDALQHVQADRAILFHLNESDRLSHEEYKVVAHQLNARREKLHIPELVFAYDTMQIEIVIEA